MCSGVTTFCEEDQEEDFVGRWVLVGRKRGVVGSI